MGTQVKLPNIGDGVESGDVLEIFVSVGETVKKEQGLIELETDKATVTVPSPQAGTITKILVTKGQSVPVGSVIVEMECTAAPAAPAASKPVAAPAPGPGKPADDVAPVVAIPAKTATPTSPPAAPASSARPAPPARPTPAVVDAPLVASSSPVFADDEVGDVVAASPAVRRFAREVGVDLSIVDGTGEGGRITRDDVLRSVRESSARASSAVITSAPRQASGPTAVTTVQPIATSAVGGNKPVALPGTPGSDDHGPVRVEKMSKIRKTIANQMHKSWTTVPRVTNFDDADVTDLEAFRQSSKDDYAAQGIKLTTMPFLMKAVAIALRNHPAMNALIDMEGDQVVYRDYVNLGVAIDTERGLVVPNIRNAHQLSIPDIARALADLAARVRMGDFGVNELRGGTFTISNLGAIGGTYSTPIVNFPEVAILLVGRTRKLPVVMDDDSIQVRQMMPLSLSYDHRLVDGGTAARFLNDVIALLEAPSRLLLAIS
jgi:pyruvate dehydrogenase E2 component (dihydrolipoamide acetyltransferase)